MSIIYFLIIVGSILVAAYVVKILVELIMDFRKPFLDLDFSYPISRENERLLKIPDPCPGDLPHSIKLDGKFYRLHQKQYFWSGNEFWKTFEDGPWKWESQQRYAGKNRNPGHFFALNRKAAKEEAAHYKVDNDKYFMMRMYATFNNILDLTDEDNIHKFVLRTVANPEEISFMDTGRFLRWLVDVDTGGSEITDIIGMQVYRDGYQGVLFYSSRIFDQLDRNFLNSTSAFERNMWMFGAFLKYRKVKRYKCLVVFSGSGLARCVSRYSSPDGMEVENALFGKSEEEIDKLLVYKQEYQEQMKHKYAQVSLPAIIVTANWSPEGTQKDW